MPKRKKVPPNPTSLDRILRSDILIQVDFEKENYKKLAKFASKILNLIDEGELERLEHMSESDREELEEALVNVGVD